jgi:hypothetical protein
MVEAAWSTDLSLELVVALLVDEQAAESTESKGWWQPDPLGAFVH